MCDHGTFGKYCNSRCHCLKRVGCNNVNGECPNGDCDSGWKPGTCSESIFKLFLLWNWTLWLITKMFNGFENEYKFI